MGMKVGSQDGKNQEYVKAVKGFLETYMTRFFSILQQNEFLFSLMPGYNKYVRDLKTLKNFSNMVIQQRKKEMGGDTKEEKGDAKEDEFGVKKRVAFLDLLLQLSEGENKLTDAEIREEVDTFMFEVKASNNV